ncbi:hypothetical protein BDU57DRAFT_510700 [Ampelomyces quisqualis]|uniref:Uncharacterized protein n=1 Tax=Ampelomyces quisqualis TaxID=50730 RepID=A0A6A5R2W2_AMPQU|nr:hypothetical protein BDU57DRAFT_510700 [Ampelomyces quisqualis]
MRTCLNNIFLITRTYSHMPRWPLHNPAISLPLAAPASPRPSFTPCEPSLPQTWILVGRLRFVSLAYVVSCQGCGVGMRCYLGETC